MWKGDKGDEGLCCWLPASSTVCAGDSFQQSRYNPNTEPPGTEYRNAVGTCSECCSLGCPSLPGVCFNGVYSRNWVNYFVPGFCDLMALGPDDFGIWELVAGNGPTEFMGFGLPSCPGSCVGTRDPGGHPIFGTYTVKSGSSDPNDPGFKITIYEPVNGSCN